VSGRRNGGPVFLGPDRPGFGGVRHPAKRVGVADLITATILGAFIGGLTVAFSDRWSGSRIMPRWVISGTVIGIVAGLLAGLAQIPITNNLGEKAPILTRLIAWMLAGSFIGCGLGLRWVQVNRARVAHAFAGGLLGGALGWINFCWARRFGTGSFPSSRICFCRRGEFVSA